MQLEFPGARKGPALLSLLSDPSFFQPRKATNSVTSRLTSVLYLMDSNVGYIRQTNDDEQPISYEQRYSQYDSQPVGYAEYGHGASESVSLDRNEDFEPPALHHKRPQTDFASVALQGTEASNF